jgi:dolichyl-phosphate-mannose--protein O-mannosyl transferase
LWISFHAQYLKPITVPEAILPASGVHQYNQVCSDSKLFEKYEPKKVLKPSYSDGHPQIIAVQLATNHFLAETDAELL